MRIVMVVLVFVLLSQPLTGCWAFLAGAGGGYIYKQKENEGKVP